MKLAPKTIFVFDDPEGFGLAIYNALQPDPSFHVKKEEVFELYLEKYGIRDVTVQGDLAHFVNHKGLFEVSILLLKTYEPPVVACVINEVLAAIIEDNSSSGTTLILPYFVLVSKLSSEMVNRKVPLYSTQIGPAPDASLSMLEGTQKLPASVQIHYEPLACLLHLVHILKLPTTLLIVPRGGYESKETTGKEHEALHEMVKFLARNVRLPFTTDTAHLNVTEKAKVSEEPWRALYG